MQVITHFTAYHDRMTRALAEVTTIANAVNAQISQFTLVLSRRGIGSTTTPETTDPDPDQGNEDGSPGSI